MLKNGQRYSGRFVRGDANVIEFQILGRTETFKVSEVSQIQFQEPEISAPVQAPVPVRTVTPTQDAVPTPTVTVNAVKPVAAGSTITFPAGTSLTIRTTKSIDTDQNKVGDTFAATLDVPLTVGDRVVVPKGTEVDGKIAYAKESGKITGQSQLILELTDLKLSGKSYILRTSDYSEAGASRTAETAKAAGGVAAVGAIIGAIAGGGKGAAIGAASGAAVGTGAVVLTKGTTLKIPAETLLEFKLERDLVITP